MSAHGREKGAILLIAALSFMVVVLFAGLAIDSGLLQLHKLRMQTAADAAAISAAHELLRSNPKGVEEAARAAAALNGCGPAAAGENQIEIHHPPTQGRYTGDADAVEVIATHKGTTLMIAVSGRKPAVVVARAVGRRSPGGSGVILGE